MTVSDLPHLPRALLGRTAVISGGSRGIGLATAKALGLLGANVVLLAKTSTPDPRLPGTIHTAVQELKAAGIAAVAVVGDVRSEDDVARAVATAVDTFGGVDIVINNASAINVAGTEELEPKRFDLMQQVNVRGTFLLTRACLPELRRAPRAHVITLSPPLNLNPKWLGAHPAYTLSKYGMTLLSLGWAAEFADTNIAFVTLWPETFIATAAVANVLGGEATIAQARSPEIMADAAARLCSLDANGVSGQSLLDVEVLDPSGTDDFARYGGGATPKLDIFVDHAASRQATATHNHGSGRSGLSAGI